MLFINVYCSASENIPLESKEYNILKLVSFTLLNYLTCDVDMFSHHV